MCGGGGHCLYTLVTSSKSGTETYLPRLGKNWHFIADQLTNIVLFQHPGSVNGGNDHTLMDYFHSLADVEVVVGLKKNGNISTCPQHQLVNSSRVPLYEPTHVIHLENQSMLCEPA